MKIRLLTIILLQIFIQFYIFCNQEDEYDYYNKAFKYYFETPSNIDSAFFYANKSYSYYKSGDDFEKRVKLLLLKCRIYYLRFYTDSMRIYLSEAENSSIKKGIIIPELYELKGLFNTLEQNKEEAIDNLNRAIDLYKRKSKNNSNIPRVIRYIGNVYYNSDKYQKAAEYYFVAKEMAEKTNNYNELAKTNHSLGLCYYLMGDFNNAFKYFNITVSLVDQYKLYDDYEKAVLFVGLASLYNNSAELDKAIELYQKAETLIISQFNEYHPSLIDIYILYGILLYNKQELERAGNYLTKALNLIDYHKTHKKSDIVSVYYYLGTIASNLKKYDEALNFFNKAEQYSKVKANYLSAGINEGIAMVYSDIKKYDLAEKYYLKSLNGKINKYGINSYTVALTYQRLGNFYSETDQFIKSLLYFNKAIDLLKKLSLQNQDSVNNVELAWSYYYLAKVYLKHNDALKSLKTVQKSFISLIPEFKNELVDINPVIEKANQNLLAILCFKLKADAFSLNFLKTNDIKDLQKSLLCYKNAITLLMRYRSSFFSINDQLYFTDTYQEIFNTALKICSQLKNITNDKKYDEEAFNIIENNKASILLMSIKNSEAKITAKIPDSLIVKEKQINSRIEYVKNIINEEKFNENINISKISVLKNELFNLEKQKESLIYFLEKNFKKYYQLKYYSYVNSLNYIKKRLKNDEVLLEYYIADSVLHSILITNNNQIWHTQKLSTDFYQNIKIFSDVINPIEYLKNPDKNLELYISASNVLYYYLIKPFENFLKENIIIIPDPDFGYLPFEILANISDKNYSDYKSIPYLINSYNISYSYSSNLLFENNRQKREKISILYAFGTTFLNDTTKIARNNLRGKFNGAYKPIPGVKDEIMQISKLLPSKIYLDNNATENNFKAIFNKSGIVHIATHTYIDESNPMYSKLIFYPVDSIEDGLLNAYELYNMNTKISMAVLSACKTGFGKSYKGEGIMNFARAFIYAGCPTVIMTLWLVEDNSSAVLMKYFYKFLIKGKSISESLRLAKLEFLRTADALHSHPYFWSGYVLIGIQNPLFYKPLWILYIFIPLFIIVIGILIYLYRKKKVKC